MWIKKSSFLEPILILTSLNMRDIHMADILFILDTLKYGIAIVLLLGLKASILSPFVVLNEQSFIADGLSHVNFSALVICLFFIEDPFYIGIPVVVFTSVFIKWF